VTRSSNSTTDPLVVATPELAVVLQRWVDEFRVDHPVNVAGNRGSTNDVFGEHSWFSDYRQDSISENIVQQGAMTLLAEHLHRDTRVFTRILNLETAFTSLELADDILAFIERPDATHNGEIHVVPNPYWNQERWIDWYLEERRGC